MNFQWSATHIKIRFEVWNLFGLRRKFICLVGLWGASSNGGGRALRDTYFILFGSCLMSQIPQYDIYVVRHYFLIILKNWEWMLAFLDLPILRWFIDWLIKYLFNEAKLRLIIVNTIKKTYVTILPYRSEWGMLPKPLFLLVFNYYISNKGFR